MLKKLLVIVLSVLLIFGTVLPVFADDPKPGSKEDNACYPGGAMEGKCDTEWEWVCGYYLAHWLTAGGWFNGKNSIPDSCISLLPPKPLPSVDGPVIGVCSVDAGTNAVYCVYSDQTGTVDNGPVPDGQVDGYYLFVLPLATCPSSVGPFAGPDIVGGVTTVLLAQHGFSATTFTTLVLNPNWCFYTAP
jgi:hypothetical protein